MQVMMMAAVLLAAAPSAPEADAKMRGYLDLMRLAFACSSNPDIGEYRAAKEMAQRKLMMLTPGTSMTISDITGLDRDLRAGTAAPAQVNRGDCENLLLEAKAALRAAE